MASLKNLTVVELAGSVGGAYCAKLFADQGASVTVVGSSTINRHQQAYFHERTAVSDLTSIDWSSVDVVIESSAPGPLTPALIDAANAIRVQISPFGSSGPYKEWRATDLVDYAISGHAYLYGDPAREPLRGPPDQPAVAAGLYGFIGAMAALFARTGHGMGQIVEVSHLEVMVALHQVTLLRWSMTGDVLCRMGNRYTGQGQPNGPYPCKDGWVSIVGVTEPQVEALLAVTGLSHLLDHPDISGPDDLQAHSELLDVPLVAWLSKHLVDDVVDLFQALRIPACPVRSPIELLDDPQLMDRAFFRPLDTDPALKTPRVPFTFRHHQGTHGKAWTPGATSNGPLTGLRVLDLARVWAGPLCTRTLSDLGAEVTWVEAPFARGPRSIPPALVAATRYFPDDQAGDRPWNRNGHLIKYSLGKRSLVIDLQQRDGVAAFERLVPDHHVLVENFSSRVMPQFGLDEDRLHQLNPDLIYATMPGYGRTGPATNWLAYGSCVDSHAGLSNLIGYADASPWKGGVAWPDPVAGLHACCAILVALWAASEGAGGVTIESAQFESTVAAIGDRVLQAQIEGPFVARGNDDDAMVLQGVYRCIGHDEWIAVSIPDIATLTALVNVLDIDPAANRDTIEADLASHAAASNADELTERLQRAGVPAGPVATAPMVARDRHLRERGAWVTVDQPDVGAFTTPLTPIALSRDPATVRNAAPTFGQHNDQVLRESGLSPAEIDALKGLGVVTNSPPR